MVELNELTRRNQGRNMRKVMEDVKMFIRGWVDYYYAIDMKEHIGMSAGIPNLCRLHTFVSVFFQCFQMYMRNLRRSHTFQFYRSSITEKAARTGRGI